MVTLTFGFKQPQTGDKGSVWFPALEDVIEQLNDHDHDGTNSSRLSAGSAVINVTQSISSGPWSAVSGQDGTYRQLVTVPAGIQSLDECVVTFKDSSTKDVYFLTYERQSSTTYYVYINDNSKSLIANYGV